MTSSKTSLLIVAAIAALTSSSYATIIAPGGAVIAAGGSIGSSTVTQAISSHSFTGVDSFSNVVFTGTETSGVFSNDTSNPLGGLTFVYVFNNDSTSPDSIDRVTLSGFAGFAVDAVFLTPDTGNTPVVITRTPSGDVVGFDYSAFGFPNQDVLPGQHSAELIIRTNATDFAPNTMALQDGGNGTVTSYGPAVGSPRTPEPASLGILSVSAIALAARRRRR